MTVSDVYAKPDGSVLFTDPVNSRIRLVTNSLPDYDLNPITITSKNGKKLYTFDKNGKHLKTEDALTGNTIYEFSYDDKGLLTGITDLDGLATVIQRDAEGNPTAIISPFGQQTLLELNENGLLQSITDPQGNKQQFFYDENGLMTRMIDPRGGEYNFTYDEYGKLIKDEDPAGGWKELTKEELDNGFEVTYSTAEGLSKKYKSYLKNDGSKIMENTNASGLTTVSESYPNGKTVLYSPDSTVTVKYLKPDPRYGMQSPLIDTLKVITPSGLTSVMTQSKTITEMSGLTVTGMTDSLTVNNKTSVSIWDGNDNSSASLSPEGRMSFTRRNDKNRVIADSIPGLLGVHYTYNSQGFLTQTRKGDRITSFTYNGQGQLESVTDPLGRTTTMEYDAVGRVTKQTLPDGREINYTGACPEFIEGMPTATSPLSLPRTVRPTCSATLRSI